MADKLDNSLSESTPVNESHESTMPPEEGACGCEGGYLRWVLNASYITAGLLVAAMLVSFAFPESAVAVSQVLPVEYRDAIFGTSTCEEKSQHPRASILTIDQSFREGCCNSQSPDCGCAPTSSLSLCETEEPPVEADLTFSSILAAARSGGEKLPPTPPVIDY